MLGGEALPHYHQQGAITSKAAVAVAVAAAAEIHHASSYKFNSANCRQTQRTIDEILPTWLNQISKGGSRSSSHLPCNYVTSPMAQSDANKYVLGLWSMLYHAVLTIIIIIITVFMNFNIVDGDLSFTVSQHIS